MEILETGTERRTMQKGGWRNMLYTYKTVDFMMEPFFSLS